MTSEDFKHQLIICLPDEVTERRTEVRVQLHYVHRPYGHLDFHTASELCGDGSSRGLEMVRAIMQVHGQCKLTVTGAKRAGLVNEITLQGFAVGSLQSTTVIPRGALDVCLRRLPPDCQVL